MTLKEFADILGVSVSYLSDVEHQRRLVSPKKAFDGYPHADFIRYALQDEANNFLYDKGMKADIHLKMVTC